MNMIKLIEKFLFVEIKTKDESVKSYNFIFRILKYSLVINFSLIFYTIFIGQYKMEGYSLFRVIGFSFLFWSIVSIIQIMNNLKSKINYDLKFIVITILIFGISYGFGIFSALNNWLTIDKINVIGKVGEKKRIFSRTGRNAIVIKTKKHSYWVFFKGIEYTMKGDFIETGDKVELELEKSFFGLYKNPKIKKLKEGDNK